MQVRHFKSYSKKDLLSLTHIRKFETKIGERVQVLKNVDQLAQSFKESNANYILFGIAEDIGIRANEGKPGADKCWQAFLPSFMNTQSNDFLMGEDVMIAGYFDFSDLLTVIEQNAPGNDEKTDAYRHAVITIDEEVEGLVKLIVSENKIPIVIGGGHNNAYPLIKGAAKGLHQAQKIGLPQINCINLDAHTDYRPSEGRHSGNAFRYAEEDGFLQKYCVIGVHENYLPQNVWMDIVNNPFFDMITYEDIFIHEKRSFRQAVSLAVGFTDDNYTGLELDLDSIENIASSAATPCGIETLHARQYINLCAAHTKACYLHICEGAPDIDNNKKDLTGKLINYLVSDFIKMNKV